MLTPIQFVRIDFGGNTVDFQCVHYINLSVLARQCAADTATATAAATATASSKNGTE
jgi:hypothetical protein